MPTPMVIRFLLGEPGPEGGEEVVGLGRALEVLDGEGGIVIPRGDGGAVSTPGGRKISGEGKEATVFPGGGGGGRRVGAGSVEVSDGVDELWLLSVVDVAEALENEVLADEVLVVGTWLADAWRTPEEVCDCVDETSPDSGDGCVTIPTTLMSSVCSEVSSPVVIPETDLHLPLSSNTWLSLLQAERSFPHTHNWSPCLSFGQWLTGAEL